MNASSNPCIEAAWTAFKLSRGCVENRWTLFTESVRSCRDTGEGSVRVNVRGFRVEVPVSQLPEAWLNMVHVLCLEDYGVYEGFTPRAGWTVIDVGAYLGFYTLWAARLVGGKGRVVAVEPNPWARPFIYENAVANGLDDRVSVDPRAVGDGDRIAFLHVPWYWGNASLLDNYAKAYDVEPAKVRVRVTTLESILADHGTPYPDLVKVDIEGAETAILPSLKHATPRAVVELHPPFTGIDCLRGCGRWLVYRLSTGTQLLAFGCLRGCLEHG